MKVLVATSRGQGLRGNDFSFAREGELVMLGDSHDSEAMDAGCGCRRSFVGAMTSKGTTTGLGDESGLGRAAYIEAIVSAAAEDDGGLDEIGAARKARREAARLLEVAARLPFGAVVERRGDRFRRRAVAVGGARSARAAKGRAPRG